MITSFIIHKKFGRGLPVFSLSRLEIENCSLVEYSFEFIFKMNLGLRTNIQKKRKTDNRGSNHQLQTINYQLIYHFSSPNNFFPNSDNSAVEYFVCSHLRGSPGNAYPSGATRSFQDVMRHWRSASRAHRGWVTG